MDQRVLIDDHRPITNFPKLTSLLRRFLDFFQYKLTDSLARQHIDGTKEQRDDKARAKQKDIHKLVSKRRVG